MNSLVQGMSAMFVNDNPSNENIGGSFGTSSSSPSTQTSYSSSGYLSSGGSSSQTSYPSSGNQFHPNGFSGSNSNGRYFGSNTY